MMMLGVYGQINDLVDEAKEHLVAARIKMQEAEVQNELDALYGPDFYGFGRGEMLGYEAKQFRMAARVSLKRVERLNGMIYLGGGRTVTLSRSLGGKTFRQWPTYQEQYDDSHSFQGVDPYDDD